MDETDKGALSTENTLQTTKRKTTIKDSIGVDQVRIDHWLFLI